jgi:hypothetical protein
MLRPIINPRMVANQRRIRRSFVAVQEPTQVRADDYSVVTEYHTIIACWGMLALATTSERRTAAFTNVEYTHQLDLDGYYPEILITHQIIVGREQGNEGEAFNIMAISHDSQNTRTRLALDKVTH